MKTKEELDLLSFDIIEQHKDNILSKYPLSTEDKQYILELDCYIKVRFKDKELERFNRWEKESKNPANQDIDIEAKRLVVDIGFDIMYSLGLKNQLAKIREFKYIQNIQY